MINKKQPLRIHIGKTSIGSVSEFLSTNPIPPGVIWCIQNFAIENETSVTIKVRSYVEGHGYNHYLWEQRSALAGNLYWFSDDFYIGEGEQITVTFSGTVSGDLLHIYLSGYKITSSGGGFD